MTKKKGHRIFRTGEKEKIGKKGRKEKEKKKKKKKKKKKERERKKKRIR